RRARRLRLSGKREARIMSRKPQSLASFAALAFVLWMAGSAVANAQMRGSPGFFHGGFAHRNFFHQHFFPSRPFFVSHAFVHPFFRPFRVVRVFVVAPFPHWVFQRVYVAPPVCSPY